MKRKIAKHTFRTTIFIVVLSITFIWVMKAPVMSLYLSKKLRVPVKIGRILMRPTYTTIHHFTIKNPPSIHKRTAFSAEKAEVQYQFSQLFGNPRKIESIEMDDVYLSIDFVDLAGTENNWTQIISQMPKAKKKAKATLIKKLTFNNFKVEIWGRGFNAALKKKIEIPSLVFFNINSKEGFPTEQLVNAIFSSAGIKDYLKKLLSPEGLFQEIFEPFSKQDVMKIEGSSKEEPSLYED